jgi:thioredoxin reductase (NADPH)
MSTVVSSWTGSAAATSGRKLMGVPVRARPASDRMNEPSPLRVPESPALSPTQLAKIGERGEERTADVGDVLFQVGDDRYPFVAILEGEVALLDGVGNEIVRQGRSNFLGELNLLSGQSAFLTAEVTQPLRYIAVDRDALRQLLFDDGPLSDLLLATFILRREALQQVAGLGLEIVGPHSSAATRRLVEFAAAGSRPYAPAADNHYRGGEMT